MLVRDIGGFIDFIPRESVDEVDILGIPPEADAPPADLNGLLPRGTVGILCATLLPAIDGGASVELLLGWIFPLAPASLLVNPLMAQPVHPPSAAAAGVPMRGVPPLPEVADPLAATAAVSGSFAAYFLTRLRY